MTREGVDYSGAWPSIASMRAAGKTFVVRYVTQGNRPKEITADEVAYWRAAGIDICIVFESTAGRALDGRLAGAVDANAARDDVRAVGGPADGGVVYFAVDVDTTSDAQRATVVDYLTGTADSLGWEQVGVYGEYELIAYLVTHLPQLQFFWQTYAWSHGNVHDRAQLYQYSNGEHVGGVEVDLDRAFVDNFGQWWYVQTGDEPMTDEEMKKLAAMTAQQTWTLIAQGLTDPTHPALQVDTRALRSALDQIKAGVAAQADDEAKIIGALAALKLNLSDAQVQEIADHVGINYDKIRDAVKFNVSWPTPDATK